LPIRLYRAPTRRGGWRFLSQVLIEGQGVDKNFAHAARKAAAMLEKKFEKSIAKAVKYAVAAADGANAGRRLYRPPEFRREVQPPASLNGLDVPSRRAFFVPWKPSRRRGFGMGTRLSVEEPMLSTGLHLTSESTPPQVPALARPAPTQYRRCLLRQKITYRIWGGSAVERAEARGVRIEKLRKQLDGGPARLRPSPPGRTLDRRRSLELSLKRAMVAAREDLLRVGR
jgi:hypothetical protein